MANLNVLSARYATPPLNDLFSEEGRILAERELWIAVMKAQQELGLPIPAEAIARFEAAKSRIDLARIAAIERRTRHDVKARIEAFIEAAGAGEHIHKGMTSRDLTDNVEQMQIRKAGRLMLGKYSAILRRFLDRADAYRGVVLTARTHHQPAQATLLGRRFAMWAEELLEHVLAFERFLDEYPLRGIKGPVGTQFDMLTLLGSAEKVYQLEQRIATMLGFSRTLHAPGQVYPRSLDLALVQHLALLAAPCENAAKGIRLMAGYELVTEGFREGQVGSSAMPHKMNTRSAERVCGLAELLKMYADGASRLAGDQWEEGDVSCSVLRRVVIPDAFYASDGLCETMLTILRDMGIFPAAIARECTRYAPFLATTEFLALAVKCGIGREEAHEAIRRHAVAAALRLRNGEEPRPMEALAEDPLFQKAGLTREVLGQVLDDVRHFVGRAGEQIDEVRRRAEPFLERHAREAAYEPGEIL